MNKSDLKTCTHDDIGEHKIEIVERYERMRFNVYGTYLYAQRVLFRCTHSGETFTDFVIQRISKFFGKVEYIDVTDFEPHQYIRVYIAIKKQLPD